MTTAFWCVFIAAFLPYVWVVFAKSKPNYNNRAPREFLERLEGWRKRANWAQMNAYEAFPPFAAAVLVAQSVHAPQERVDVLAMVFVGARVAHGFLYMADLAALRSVIWFIGLGCVIGIFLAGS